jgi:hypothetical protein
MIDHTFTQGGLYAVKCVVTDSRGKTSLNTAQLVVEVDLPFNKAVSRKVHNNIPRDIELALSGPVTVEPRDSGPGNTHQLIFDFVNNITAAGSATLTGTGSASQPTIGPGANQLTVNLSGVTDLQHLVVTLNGVQDNTGVTFNNLPVKMDVIAGDTDGDGRVNVTDTNQTRSFSGAVTDDTNARIDVNVDGRINVADANYVKAHSGNSIPSTTSRSRAKQSR